MKGLTNHLDYMCDSIGDLAKAIEEIDKDLAQELWVASGCLVAVMDKIDKLRQIQEKEEVRKWIEDKNDWSEAAISWFEHKEYKELEESKDE
jgi:GTP-binding protein EngB required for normal cell division